MRQHRFRAWHEYGALNDRGIPSFPGMIYDDKPGDCLHWKAQGEKIVAVMQLTGLKDKNGKEIFEGDRVKFKHVIIIKSKRSTGEIMWDSSDACFFIMSDDDDYPHVQLWFAADIEVIGNIYEQGGKD